MGLQIWHPTQFGLPWQARAKTALDQRAYALGTTGQHQGPRAKALQQVLG
jgi:hypothetical protein